MKITAMRVRALVSNPVGFGHHAIELEVQLEEEDNGRWQEIADSMEREIKGQIAKMQRRDRLQMDHGELTAAVAVLQDRKDRLEAEIAGYRKVELEFEKLGELARRHGLHAAADKLPDEIPF